MCSNSDHVSQAFIAFASETQAQTPYGRERHYNWVFHIWSRRSHPEVLTQSCINPCKSFPQLKPELCGSVCTFPYLCIHITNISVCVFPVKLSFIEHDSRGKKGYRGLK